MNCFKQKPEEYMLVACCICKEKCNNKLNLEFQTWQGVMHFPEWKEERSGPYLFPPLQLTKDTLKALMHVVKLGGKREQNCYSAFKYSTISLQATFFSQLSLLPLSTALITCEAKCVGYQFIDVLRCISRILQQFVLLKLTSVALRTRWLNNTRTQ